MLSTIARDSRRPLRKLQITPSRELGSTFQMRFSAS